MDYDLFDTLTPVVLAAPASVTATGNVTGVSLATDNFILGGIAILTALNTAGSTPTYNCKLQSSPDNTNWTDIPGAVFTQVTTGNEIQVVPVTIQDLPPYIRVVDTITGTSSPAYTRGVVLLGRKKVI